MDPIKRAEAIKRFTAILTQPAVRAELEGVMRALWPDEPDGEMRVQVLRSHAHRCTFGVTFGPPEGERRFVAKVYDEDHSHVLSAMESVAATGFGPTAMFSIPKPFAYLQSAHVFVQEWVRGTEAVEIFRGDDLERQIEAAGRCGTWLGEFHTKAPVQGRLRDPSRMDFGIRFWAQELREAGEPYSSKAEQLRRELAAVAPAVFGGFAPRAGHGTYMAEHVVLSGARTVSIDIDEYQVTDPGWDLAWFIVSLQRLGLDKGKSIRAHDRAVQEFVRGYAASGPQVGLSHLPFYLAAACLYQGHHDLYNRTVPLKEWSAIMLDEGIYSLGRDFAD